MTRDRLILSIAAAAIGFAAADTYVVVLALPDMMTSAGLGPTEVQRAAPIVSGFLLGYVGVLPLIGRVSDLRGRTAVLLGSLLVFAFGSVITATGYDLSSIIAGRFFQGVGGGGLIPPTLALIADRWPPERRGLPLGVIGAVQEFGSVVGPLLGAAVLALGSWHDIFWLNCLVALLLAAALWWVSGEHREIRDLPGIALLALTGVAFLLILLDPEFLVTGVTTGLAYLPVVGESTWLTPLALTAYALFALFWVRQTTAKKPLVDWRGWLEIPRATDLIGAAALTIALGAVVITFAAADPENAKVSESAYWLLPLALVATAVFIWRQRTAKAPLVPRGTLAARPAWGAVIVSFLVGSSLIAALVDVPVFAGLTTARGDQLGAAMVLLRFLIAVPVGAIIGGALLRKFSAALVAGVGMTASAVAFAIMASWNADALTVATGTIVLAVNGFGFGLSIAPVNEALLDHTASEVHGVASSLIVVARMVGMLIGISALTFISLEAYFSALDKIPDATVLCPDSQSTCHKYNSLMFEAAISQLNAAFLAAAVIAGLAALLSFVLLKRDKQAAASVAS